MTSSIRHKPAAHGLPDFRNLGVILRIVLGVNLVGAFASLLLAPDLGGWWPSFVAIAHRLQVPLLLCLLLFAAVAPLLRRLPAIPARLLVVATTVLLVTATEVFWSLLGFGERGSLLRVALLGAGLAAVLLGYFGLRQRGADPAANAARLAALTARIRPHFLFNSLNAVLSLIRSDPRRAEHALESLAELFRVLMRDPRDLVPLSEEIELCRQYLDLEKLRLGDRLAVDWRIADVPDDALVPPLMLQPLLENAVYHGIEPADTGGTVTIGFAREDDGLVIEIANPVGAGGEHSGGNQMALANIRERLALHYDLEARLLTREEAGNYRVRIELPYRPD